MATFKITVLRRHANMGLADTYCVEGAAVPCDRFVEGQEFLTDGLAEPEGFRCGWAWNDIAGNLMILRQGGDFAGWSKDPQTIVRCCTDGIRPVVFKITLVDGG